MTLYQRTTTYTPPPTEILSEDEQVDLLLWAYRWGALTSLREPMTGTFLYFDRHMVPLIELTTTRRAYCGLLWARWRLAERGREGRP